MPYQQLLTQIEEALRAYAAAPSALENELGLLRRKAGDELVLRALTHCAAMFCVESTLRRHHGRAAEGANQ